MGNAPEFDEIAPEMIKYSIYSLPPLSDFEEVILNFMTAVLMFCI